MFNRKHIAIIALAAASVSTGALATGDAGVRHAERLLEEARGFGDSNSEPSRFTNDGSRSTNHGALSNATANQPASARSVGSGSEPSRFTNDGSRSTNHGGLATGNSARAGANADNDDQGQGGERTMSRRAILETPTRQ